MTQSSMTYRDAGVDIDEADALVGDIRQLAAPTQRPETLGAVGGFGALMRIPQGYKDPVLVSGTDGVGTKLRLAIDTGRVRGLGVDLVAMCVNDILCLGAEPLFFLDYYATGVLERKVAADVVAGIADGCLQAGCSLIGGETAEMPGMYGSGDFDLAGFAVGVVEGDAIIDGRARVRPGDALIGLPSSGLHANGYSLVRAILARSGATLDQDLAGETLADHLLKPTRIYCAPVRALLAEVPVHGMAHITGGGLTENIPRFLPEGCGVRIDPTSWQRPALFDWLAEAGNVDGAEMLRTFNCGIGFVLAVPSDRTEDAMEHLRSAGEAPVLIGAVEENPEAVVRYSA